MTTNTDAHTDTLDPTGGDAASDPRPLFATAAALATAVIGGVTDDQLHRPTPCATFDVTALLGHVAVVAPRITSLGHGVADYSHGGEAPVWPAERYASTFATDMAEAATAWDDPESLRRTIELPWTSMSGADVLRLYMSELTVHTWDLARATGQDVAFDPAVAEASLAFLHNALPPEIRVEDPAADEVPFAPVVAVAAEAAAIDRLVAWTGRDPAWR